MPIRVTIKKTVRRFVSSVPANQWLSEQASRCWASCSFEILASNNSGNFDHHYMSDPYARRSGGSVSEGIVQPKLKTTTFWFFWCSYTLVAHSSQFRKQIPFFFNGEWTDGILAILILLKFWTNVGYALSESDRWDDSFDFSCRCLARSHWRFCGAYVQVSSCLCSYYGDPLAMFMVFFLFFLAVLFSLLEDEDRWNLQLWSSASVVPFLCFCVFFFS